MSVRSAVVAVVLSGLFLGCNQQTESPVVQASSPEPEGRRAGEPAPAASSKQPSWQSPAAQSGGQFSAAQSTGQGAVQARPQFDAQAGAGQQDRQPGRLGAESPAEVVEAFLVSLRDSNDATAEALLTQTAREETSKHGLTVRPPGSPSAEFEVGTVEFVDAEQTLAHVNSIWTERDAAGNDVSYEVVWALRDEAPGWRIAGLATLVVEGKPPVFLNFEDPSDMLSKMRRAEQMAGQQPQQMAEQPERSSSKRR